MPSKCYIHATNPSYLTATITIVAKMFTHYKYLSFELFYFYFHKFRSIYAHFLLVISEIKLSII